MSGFVIEPLTHPMLLPCGAYISQRDRFVRCHCYGRRVCSCAADTNMPCERGTHYTPGGRRAEKAAGRLNTGFVDINHGRRGLGKGETW